MALPGCTPRQQMTGLLQGDRVILPLYASQTIVGYYGAAYRVLDITIQIAAMIMGIIMPLVTYAWSRQNIPEFKNGSQIHLSNNLVMNCDFEPNRTAESHTVINAYENNDRDLFYKMYADHSRQIHIEENWREVEPIWKRKKY
jgi:hypothetical protein